MRQSTLIPMGWYGSLIGIDSHDPLNPLEDDDDNLEEDEEQMKADRLYADKFKGSNICPVSTGLDGRIKTYAEALPHKYCSERMPADSSPYLISLEKRLHDLSMSDHGAESSRKLDWKQYSEFCALHEAETTTIPLGLRDGFPGSIDFVAIEGRLTNGDWLSAELTAIAEDPYRSALFEIVLSDIARMGKTQWGGINHQSNRRTVGLSLPG